MSFNPQEVFSSLQSFLSSGYIFLAIVILLSVGIIKKLVGILVTAVVIGVIWLVCQDQIISVITQLLQLVG